MYICINLVTPVFFVYFWTWTEVFQVEKFKTPSGKLRNSVKLKTRIFQRQGFNPTATICGHHKRFLRSVQTSMAWDQKPADKIFILWLCCCINRCAHMLLILPWVHTFSAWVSSAVRVWPVIGCDCALHGQWSSELSFGSSCSVTVSAASPQTDTDQYPHRVPLITRNIRKRKKKKASTSSFFCVLQTHVN